MSEQLRPDLALFELAHEDPFQPPRQQSGQVGVAHGQRQFSQILALKRQDIESVELNFVVMSARVHPIEIGYSVDPEQNGLAINDEGTRAVPQPARLDDQRN
jgi:hypothetical protein